MRFTKGKAAAVAVALGLSAALTLPCGAALADEAKPGWSQDAGDWHYVKDDGSAAKGGWLEVGGKWYLFDGAGTMLTGWAQVGGQWYYLKDSGAMVTGWAQVGGQWYYLKGSGAMATGWYTVGGEWNWSDSDGVWHANRWAEDSKGWWYAWADGTYPRSSWQLIEGNWYHFDGSGYMQTGWYQVGGSWYYSYDDGSMASSRWIYGYLNSDESYKGAPKYWLGADGAMVTGWYYARGDWYYADGSGVMQSNRWVGDYWLTDSGAMATDSWVDGGRYYVGADGVWVPNCSQQPSKPNQPSNPGSSDVTAQANHKIEGGWTIQAVSNTGASGLAPALGQNKGSIIFAADEDGYAGLRFVSQDKTYYGTWSFVENSDDSSIYDVTLSDTIEFGASVSVVDGEETLILIEKSEQNMIFVFALHSRD